MRRCGRCRGARLAQSFASLALCHTASASHTRRVHATASSWGIAVASRWSRASTRASVAICGSAILPACAAASVPATRFCDFLLVSSLWCAPARLPMASPRAAAPFSGATVAPSNSMIFCAYSRFQSFRSSLRNLAVSFFGFICLGLVVMTVPFHLRFVWSSGSVYPPAQQGRNQVYTGLEMRLGRAAFWGGHPVCAGTCRLCHTGIYCSFE